MKPLPFKVPMLSQMAAADSESSKLSEVKGKNEVVFVAGLPDEGVFDWADKFLEANPSYTELSTRSMLKWCERSGLRQTSRDNSTLDKPNFNFGIAAIDNKTMFGSIETLTRFAKRNFLVVEV